MSKGKSEGLGGKQLTYEAPIPKFLQKMVGKEKVEEALQKERDKRREELPDREEDDNPVIEADESLKEEYKKHLELIKLQQEALEAERQYHEEQRLKKQLQSQSKFHTTEETTHVFKVKSKTEDDESSGLTFKKRKRPDEKDDKPKDVKESELKKPRLSEESEKRTPILSNRKLLSFAEEVDEDE